MAPTPSHGHRVRRPTPSSPTGATCSVASRRRSAPTRSRGPRRVSLAVAAAAEAAGPPPRPRRALPRPRPRRADDPRRRAADRPGARAGRDDLRARPRRPAPAPSRSPPRAARSPSTPWTSTPSGRSGRPCSPTRCPARPGPDRAIVDPARIGPAFWFQQMDEPRPQRNRIHIDVTVPHDVAEARVAAAVAAGGTPASATRRPARSGCSPTPRATRSACAPGRTATEGSGDSPESCWLSATPAA